MGILLDKKYTDNLFYAKFFIKWGDSFDLKTTIFYVRKLSLINDIANRNLL